MKKGGRKNPINSRFLFKKLSSKVKEKKMCSCKGRYESSSSSFDRSKFISKTPHFFKIIMEKSVEDDKLQIPPKFADKYGGAIPNHVQLKVPNGEVWTVEYRRYDNGEVWLHKGWKDFRNHYSLRYAHMVSFKYQGNAHFRVVIFDKTATEIEYPHHIIITHSKDKEPNIVQIDDDDTSVETSGHLSRRKRKEKSPLPSHHARKMKKTVQEKKKTKLISTPYAFKSKKPFFRIIMRPSYLTSRASYVNLPLNFARRHLKESNGDIVLKVSDGRSWKVEYKLLGKNGCLKSARFYDGWRAFIGDNKLKVNDVCIFELENPEEITLNAFIFPIEEDQNISKNPFFKVVMPISSIEQRHLRPPTHFVKKYGKKLGTNVTLHTAGKSWIVKYSKLGLFTSGWSIFATDNSLQVGDTCSFELIKPRKSEFKVSIYKCSAQPI